MIELISIHIPKTGGTSFYHILQQVYGNKLSVSYKRKDYEKAMQEFPNFSESIPGQVEVLHGHLYYQEVKAIHESTAAKVICWLRDPVERVISNYRFFKAGLKHPASNPENYFLNKHRVNETLIAYASLPENRNRMTAFLDGISLEELFFFGLLEYFGQEIQRLRYQLGWPPVEIPKLNYKRSFPEEAPDKQLRMEIAALNTSDCELYARVCKLRGIEYDQRTNFK